MSDERFTEGELFVYVNGDRWELGMVKRPNRTGDGYFCWYSTGDTAANTPTRCMHKLANHGFTMAEGLLRTATSGLTGNVSEKDSDECHAKALREAYTKGYEDGVGVANAKDAQAEYLRGKNDGYDEGFDAGFASADDWLGQHEDAMAEHGWIKLPVDADGKVVRVGDVMVMASHPFGCESKPLVVDRMELSRGMHGEVWCLALDTDRSCWTQAAVLRHYHAPTVEDVLAEFFSRYVTTKSKEEDDAIIAEYAARLQLKED